MASSKETENLTAGLIIFVVLIAGLIGVVVRWIVEEIIKIINKQQNQ
jgi:uncharacterized membrane protein YagU involved in acid resistance